VCWECVRAEARFVSVCMFATMNRRDDLQNRKIGEVVYERAHVRLSAMVVFPLLV
jgi:hypothetical protein